MGGVITQKIGYYVPAMFISPIIMSIGEGLMTTFTRDTDTSRWIAYQFLAGFGLGFAMQTGNLAMQTILPPQDIPSGIAIIFFFQQLGGALFTSVGQTLLSNILTSRLSGIKIPGVDVGSIVGEGATDLISTAPPEFLQPIIDAYNYAITRIFFVAMGLSLCALLCALPMEWKSIKTGKPGGPPGGAPGGGPPKSSPDLEANKSANTSGPSIELKDGNNNTNGGGNETQQVNRP